MNLVQRLRAAYARVGHFLARGIWEQRLERLPARRARAYLAARVAYTILRGLLFEDTLHVRAAALTYFTVLSLVPLLAFAFALLKGFGAYDVLVEQTIRPQLDSLLHGNQALATAFDQILNFVDHTGVTSLGFVGLLTLLYAATRLLRNIERALNELWGVTGGRAVVEQLRDYVAIIVVTPLCLIGAAGLTTAGQALSLLRAAGETLGLGGVLDTLIGLLGPLGVLFVGLLVLYKVMPYTRVSMGSAALGAVVGALLWYVVLIAHVRFQVGVARFNALYSSFGAIPIFLAWLQLSWLVVLVGAQVSSSHQNTRALARQKRRADDDRAEEERCGLSATLIIANAFLRAEEPPTCSALAQQLDRTEGFLRTQLELLVKARILARVDGRSEPVFVLARPAAQIRVKDALDALRELPAAAPGGPPCESGLQQRARELWQAIDEAASQSSANRTLQEVLAEQDAAASAPG